jgi:hypothetical protein
MKILFAGRSVAHFSYYQTIIKSLYEHGHQLEILFDQEWSRSPFGDSLAETAKCLPDLTIAWSLRRSDGWRNLLFRAREIRTFASYLSRGDQSEFYLKRWQNYLQPDFRKWVDRPWIRTLMGMAILRCLLRWFESLTPPDPDILKWLKANRPDVLVASPVNMRFSEEIEYVKAAKSISIPTVIPVLSWDNLTTKGIFHVIPDYLLAWNGTQKTEAICIHGVPEHRVIITGSPFFDKWFDDRELQERRTVFCQRVGMDPGKPFMTYLGSSANIARDETWLVKDLHVQLRNHPDPDMRRLGILVRPHPANAKHFETLEGDGLHVWPIKGALPEVRQTQKDFYSSLQHCIGAFGINTTGMIDTVIIGKPCLTMLSPTYRSTQEQAAHFKELLSADVLEITQTIPELVDSIRRVIKGEDHRVNTRLKFVRDFVRPHGSILTAGEIAALAIECAAKGMKTGEITAAIHQSTCGERAVQSC